eukprot:8780295-Karenia_brevis.AAC.2
MNEIRRGDDTKLHLGMAEPKSTRKVASMNEIRRGNDPELHVGMTGPWASAHPTITPANEIKKGVILGLARDWAEGPSLKSHP